MTPQRHREQYARIYLPGVSLHHLPSDAEQWCLEIAIARGIPYVSNPARTVPVWHVEFEGWIPGGRILSDTAFDRGAPEPYDMIEQAMQKSSNVSGGRRRRGGKLYDHLHRRCDVPDAAYLRPFLQGGRLRIFRGEYPLLEQETPTYDGLVLRTHVGMKEALLQSIPPTISNGMVVTLENMIYP
ncbi:hypothetical protein HYU19_01060 [Candidatus Woesearchaeota archaeon]|nr:hypothetical protein [Candidatus Woesearchaeota archaeon]